MKKQFVLDCSVAMSWFFKDENDDYSAKILDSLTDHTAVVPQLWHLEAVNTLLQSEKRSRINKTEIAVCLELLDKLPIYIYDMNTRRSDIYIISQDNNLTPYDAVYLMLALENGLSIATKDQELIKACVKNNVKIFAKL